AGEYYALLAAAGAGMVFFVTASNLLTLFLGLEWFSIALYIMCALENHSSPRKSVSRFDAVTKKTIPAPAAARSA
ncbi:MAG TPA: hypothetical protein VM204_05300, partial [Gaiellaceae bacterium]|nr:hypothetical protein [Gaiellaceae bacterium]